MNYDFLSPADVRHTLDGRNLFEMRRAKLREIAKSLGLDAAGAKNDLLRRIAAHLDGAGAPTELAGRSKSPRASTAAEARARAHI